MKKLSAVLLAMVVLASGSMAWAVQKRRFPNDNRDTPVAHPLYGGYQYNHKSAAAEEVICTGRCLLAGIIMSTGNPVIAAITVRDTAQANGDAPAVMLGPIAFSALASGARDNVVTLPMLLTNGISIQLSSIAAGENVTVQYLDLDD